MEKEMQDAVYWLPAEFLDDDFFFQEEKSRILFSESDEEEDHMSSLAKQMTHSILLNNQTPKVMAGSPQSTLCGHESPNGKSQDNSPPSSPLENNKEDPFDLLKEAAGQVMRMRMNNHVQTQNPYSQPFNGHGFSKPSPPNPVKNPYGNFYPTPNSVLTQRQIQASQFYLLRQQQILKQQNVAGAIWGKQSSNTIGSGYVNGAPLGLNSSAWPPLQKQNPNPQPVSNMRAVFLSNSGTKRECAGTGVFLPRRAGAPVEPPRKKPNCSMVLLPVNVVQNLNLNLDELEPRPRYNGGFMFSNDAMVNRTSKIGIKSQPSAKPISGHDHINLPQEWTY